MLSKNKYIEKKNNKVTHGELGSWNAEAMYNVGNASGSKARPRYRCGKAPDQLADMEQAIHDHDTIKMAIHHCESVRIRVSTRVALAHSFAN